MEKRYKAIIKAMGVKSVGVGSVMASAIELWGRCTRTDRRG